MSENKIRQFIRNVITEGLDSEDKWWLEKAPETSELNKMPFDEEIKSELIRMFKESSDPDMKGVNPEERAQQLMEIHKKWLEIVKTKYDAKTIASKLYMYQITLNKRPQEQD